MINVLFANVQKGHSPFCTFANQTFIRAPEAWLPLLTEIRVTSNGFGACHNIHMNWFIITHPYFNFNVINHFKVRAWLNDYIPHMRVITHPCFNMQNSILRLIFFMIIAVFFIKLHWHLFPRVNITALVQMMAWHWTGFPFISMN